MFLLLLYSVYLNPTRKPFFACLQQFLNLYLNFVYLFHVSHNNVTLLEFSNIFPSFQCHCLCYYFLCFPPTSLIELTLITLHRDFPKSSRYSVNEERLNTLFYVRYDNVENYQMTAQTAILSQ